MPKGDSAEDYIQHLASSAGFTVNRVSRDSAGWDHVFDLQIPTESRPTDPLGLPVLISARIQVKSTRSHKRGIPIKLSNWRFAIDDPIPWFFIVVQLSTHSEEPTGVSIVHVDRKLVENILKKLYESSSRLKNRLNKRNHMLTWAGSNILTKPYPKSLCEFILSAVPEDLHRYATEKRNWYDTVGYSDPKSVKTTFSIKTNSEEELYKQLSQAAVGLSGSIPIFDLFVLQERFGYSFPHPKFPNSETAKLEILESPSDKDWTLSVVNEHESSLISVPVSMRFSASVFPFLPEQYWLLRIQRPCIDIILRQNTGKLSITLTFPSADEPLCIRELLHSLNLLKTLDNRGRDKLTIRLTKGQTKANVGNVEPLTPFGETLYELADHAHQLCALASQLGIKESFAISLGEMGNTNPVAQLMLNIKMGRPSLITVECELPDDLIEANQELGVVSDPRIIIEGIVYIEVIVLRGIAEVINRRPGFVGVRLKSTNLRSVASFRYAVEDEHKLPFQKIVDEQEELLQTQGVNVVIFHKFA